MDIPFGNRTHILARPEPILAFRFPGGGSLSVESTDDALDEAHGRRATDTFYVAIPGGQVLGVIASERER